MTRYPRAARDAQLKCISCNAPVTTTVDRRYVCVECGDEVLRARRSEADGGAVIEPVADEEPIASHTDDDPAVASPLVPSNSRRQPDVSFVFPTKNEEEIDTAIDWAVKALTALGLTGEIIVSDSSDDRTPEIAESRGAIVVEPGQLGYGYAYKYGFEFTRGDYIVMGDPTVRTISGSYRSSLNRSSAGRRTSYWAADSEARSRRERCPHSIGTSVIPSSRRS